MAHGKFMEHLYYNYNNRQLLTHNKTNYQP
jgi:hypothetical protein